MIFGYAYPAYECFKTTEKNNPEIEQLRFGASIGFSCCNNSLWENWWYFHFMSTNV